jgi:hypothetical protein
MSWKLGLTLVLVTSPALLMAQNGGTSRLAGRVPAAALPAIDSMIATAAAESLPTEPLVQKALEVPGQAPPEGHVAAVAAALARGLSGPIVERLLTVAPNEPPGPALHAVADLVAHHFDPDSAADLLVEAHNKGLRGVRLLDVAVAADHELQRPGGRTTSEALAHVRSILPNVPIPRRP